MALANLRTTAGAPHRSLGLLTLQSAADTPVIYEKLSPDPSHTVFKQGQPLGGDDSHMSEGPDDAHIAGEQDALISVDAGLPYLD